MVSFPFSKNLIKLIWKKNLKVNNFQSTIHNIKEFIVGNYFTLDGITKSLEESGFGIFPEEMIAKTTYELPLPRWKATNKVDDTDLAGLNPALADFI